MSKSVAELKGFTEARHRNVPSTAQALELLDSLDDYARMGFPGGVDAYGPVEALRRFILARPQKPGYYDGYFAGKAAAYRMIRSESTDTERLNFIESAGAPCMKWIARPSTTGRGYRVHQDPVYGEFNTAREAIDDAIASQDAKEPTK